MVHIIALICSAVLNNKKSSTYAEAAALVQEAADNHGIFNDNCNFLSVFQKIRTFVLFIMGSDERRAGWRNNCKVMIPLDVSTRWNSLFLMMSVARANRGSFVQFSRKFPSVKPLLPTENEWAVYEVLEKCLRPFYDFTLSVSRECPCLSDSIGILWALDDLLDDVGNREGQFGGVGPDIREAFAAGVRVRITIPTKPSIEFLEESSLHSPWDPISKCIPSCRRWLVSL